jgi:hypothetical protein
VIGPSNPRIDASKGGNVKTTVTYSKETWEAAAAALIPTFSWPSSSWEIPLEQELQPLQLEAPLLALVLVLIRSQHFHWHHGYYDCWQHLTPSS